MKRTDEDVFAPPTVVAHHENGSPEPAVGPPGWTAAGIREVLEPLVMENRRARLEQTLNHRIRSVTAVMDNPHDPHNGSAVLRSCDAFGVQRLHVLAERENFVAAERVSKGSHRWVDIIEHRDLDAMANHLRDEGFELALTHPDGDMRPQDLGRFPKLALILGNERDGVQERLANHATRRVGIGMNGFVESLNVSVSAAILLHAATRNRPGDLTGEQKGELYARWLQLTVPRADEVLGSLAPR